MFIDFGLLSRRAAKLSSALGIASLLMGMIFSAVPSPVSAAPSSQDSAPTAAVSACTPPGNWGQTTRIYYKSRPSKEWTFNVDEPEMDVTLEFFYYQDYDPDGCPFDCSTGRCQPYERAAGQSPFGSMVIDDGKEGASEGKIRQNGRLTQGTYTASFEVTDIGSINIGLRVHKRSVPTATPVTPTETPVPPTPTATDEVLPPVDTPTETPTATPTETQMPTATSETPTGLTPTPTATDIILPPVGITLTPTSLPPSTDQPTPTATDHPRPTATAPATLPPPSAPRNGTQQPAIIPITGGDLSTSINLSQGLFLSWGIGLLGLALILYGIGNRINKK